MRTESFLLAENSSVPDNARLPFARYRGAVAGEGDYLAERFEALSRTMAGLPTGATSCSTTIIIIRPHIRRSAYSPDGRRSNSAVRKGGGLRAQQAMRSCCRRAPAIAVSAQTRIFRWSVLT